MSLIKDEVKVTITARVFRADTGDYEDLGELVKDKKIILKLAEDKDKQDSGKEE